MPTTRSVTVPPAGVTAAPFRYAPCCTAEYSGTWITVPTPTPMSCCIRNDASTSPGESWFGIRPATSLTICGRSAGATPPRVKSVGLMGRAHEHVGVPVAYPRISVADATPGSFASAGIGPAVITSAS
jgi:hypothetical protein